jgi:hypothetical protein
LQTLAEPGSAIMSETTPRLVQGMAESRFAGEHWIKGKAKPQRVFRLEAIRQSAARFELALSRGLTPYVGRSCELETLKQSLAEAGMGLRVHNVVGEPGIGKSRLLYEFRQHVGQSRALVLTGNCFPDGQQTPFLLLIEVMHGLFRIAAEDGEAVIARKLDDELRALGLASAQNCGLLLHLLGLKPPEDAGRTRTCQANRASQRFAALRPPRVLRSPLWTDRTKSLPHSPTYCSARSGGCMSDQGHERRPLR